MKKTYIIPLIAFLTFAVGTGAMVLPFLPFGWFLYAVTALLLLPYFPPMEKFFRWLIRKDNSGTAKKAGDKVADLYRWAGDYQHAEELEEFSEEEEEKKKESLEE